MYYTYTCKHINKGVKNVAFAFSIASAERSKQRNLGVVMYRNGEEY